MRRGEGPKVELRFLISFKTAGVIIGKGGEHINKLREDYAVKITISDSCGPERVLSLDGDMGSIMEILHNVLNRQAANNREDGIDLRLLVHQSQAGCVIGRAGYKIKELREQSSLRTLKVYQMLCPSSTDRVIQLIGEVDKVLNCLQIIAELLEGAPPKGSRKNYDPLDADETIATEYGGWGSPGQSLGLSMLNRRNISGAYSQIFNSEQQNTNLLTSGLYTNSGGRAGNTANGNGTGSNPGNHQINNGTALSLAGNQAINQALASHHAHQHPHHALNQQFAHHQFQHAATGNGTTNNNGAGGGLHGSGAGGGGAGGAGNHGASGGISASAAMAVAAAGLPHASAAAMLAATSGQSAGGGQGTGHGALTGGSAGVGTGGGPGGATGPAGDAAAVAQQAAAAAMVAAGIMRSEIPARLSMLGRTTTAHVSVQNKMIGAIMGRGGCRISQVRQESGADIKISKQKPDLEDRIITITGTPEQIHNAQFLMQVCVKRYGDQTGVQ